MAPTHEEVAHEVVPPEVREAFDAARTERQYDGAKAGAGVAQAAA